MKVYVITSGEYSDYGIRAVALSREKAELICAMLNSTERYYSDVVTIEEYDTDEIQCDEYVVILRSKQMKSNWKVALIALGGVVAVVLMCVFGVYSSQNRAIAMEEQVKTAQSDIKVQEKRRVDLVYNLADCVKQYDSHEAETLKAVVDGRGQAGDIENVTTAITAVSEAYPELKSNENYKQLMNELSITENMIAEYRSNFNKQVKQYNRYVRKFPTSIFLNVTGYEKQSYSYLEYDVSEDAPQNLFGDK